MFDNLVPAKARPWVFLAVVVLLGALGGVIWHAVVILPTFTVEPGLVARPTSESTLTAWFAADSWFSIIGIVVSVLIGALAWFFFSHIGWPVTVVAIGGALLAALLCLQIGIWMGPDSFEARLSAARVGDLVQISLGASGATFLLWPFAAITSVLVASLLSGRDSAPNRMTP